MIRTKRLQHEFVVFIPETLEKAKLYISLEFATASHKCCCGCGREVVTPFSPRDWKMTFDGETVSLSPSIGNWKFPCKSHYFIRCDQVVEAQNWDEDFPPEQKNQAFENQKNRNPEPGLFVRIWRKLFMR